MVGSWSEWLEYGEEDLTVAKDMFEKKNYKHAAYCMQQALEKHVKSLWVAGGIKDPKKLGHDIVGNFVCRITKNLGKWEFDKKRLSQKEFCENMKITESIIKDIRRHDEIKGDFWMYSLGIRTKLSKRLQDYESKIEACSKKTNNTNVIVLITTKAKSRAYSYAKDGVSNPAKIPSVAAFATIGVTDLILLTYPHETYGRYPSFVQYEGQKQRVSSLYAEYSGGLETLIAKTDKACSYLSCVARDLDAALNK